MDEANADLIAQLCTHAGMIMEDHVDAALTIRSAPQAEWPAMVDALENAGLQIILLAQAAKTIASQK